MTIPSQPKASLFGVDFDAVSFEEAVSLLSNHVVDRPAKVVVTPNVDHVVSLRDHPDIHEVYATADFTFADGMPVVWASRWLGKRLPERVTGADLFVALCKLGQDHGWKINVFGGMPGQEHMLLDRFATVYPGLNVNIRCPGMGFNHLSEEAAAAADWVNQTRPDIVFVCLGFPRQCLWSLHNRPQLDTGLVLCVGAAMEFALGFKSRAPSWMQRSGLEWLWRLCSEPAKLWQRYLIRGPRFLGLALKERQRLR